MTEFRWRDFAFGIGLKNDMLILSPDPDLITGFNTPGDDFLGERVEDFRLDHAF